MSGRFHTKRDPTSVRRPPFATQSELDLRARRIVSATPQLRCTTSSAAGWRQRRSTAAPRTNEWESCVGVFRPNETAHGTSDEANQLCVIKTGTAVGAEPVGDVWTGRCVGSTASTTNRGPACRKVGWSAASCILMWATRPVQQVSAFGCVNGHVHEARRCISWQTVFRKKGVHGNESCVPCVHPLCFLLDVIDQRTHKGQGFRVK